MSEIDLHISIDEANLILEALGNLPFVKVFALIGKLQEQASQQLRAEVAPAMVENGAASALQEATYAR
jgi:hypothetical protein